MHITRTRPRRSTTNWRFGCDRVAVRYTGSEKRPTRRRSPPTAAVAGACATTAPRSPKSTMNHVLYAPVISKLGMVHSGCSIAWAAVPPARCDPGAFAGGFKPRVVAGVCIPHPQSFGLRPSHPGHLRRLRGKRQPRAQLGPTGTRRGSHGLGSLSTRPNQRPETRYRLRFVTMGAAGFDQRPLACEAQRRTRPRHSFLALQADPARSVPLIATSKSG